MSEVHRLISLVCQLFILFFSFVLYSQLFIRAYIITIHIYLSSQYNETTIRMSACMRVTDGGHHYTVNSNFLSLIPCGDARGNRRRLCRLDACLNRDCFCCCFTCHQSICIVRITAASVSHSFSFFYWVVLHQTLITHRTHSLIDRR